MESIIRKEDYMKKNTLEKYKILFQNKYGKRYEPLNYIKEDAPIRIKCNTCGDIIPKPHAGNLIYSKHQAIICKSCDMLYRQSINFEKKKRIILNTGFEFIDEYQGYDIPIRLYHYKCDGISIVKPDNFLENFKARKTKYCKCCSPAKKLNTEEFAKRLSQESNGRLFLIGEYISMHDSIDYGCTLCGETTENVLAGNVIRRLKCSKCDNGKGKYKQKTYQELMEEFWKYENKEEYRIVEKVILKEKAATKDRITVCHTHCGNEKIISPYLLPNYSCEGCNKKKWQEERYNELMEEINSISRGEYELIDGVYENNLSKMTIKHLKCNGTFPMSKNGFVSAGHRCPSCNSSKGEQIVKQILNEYGYKYLHNEENALCVNPMTNKALRMDFQILDDEDEVFALIEYDGKQHFEADSFFGCSNPKKEWGKNIYRDNVRNRFADDNKIPLLRIPYIYKTFDEVECLVLEFLANLKIPKEIKKFYGKYVFSKYAV